MNQDSDSPAACVTPITCHCPGTAWQNVWTRPRPSSAGRSGAAKTPPDVPIVALTTPGRTTPIPTAPAAWSPAPATTGVPGASPVATPPSAATRALGSGAAAPGGDASAGFGRLVHGRQEILVELEQVEHLARPAPLRDVEQERP